MSSHCGALDTQLATNTKNNPSHLLK